MLENTRWEPGETENDPELWRASWPRSRRLRERRVRRGPPRPRLHRGRRRATCGPPWPGCCSSARWSTLRSIVEAPERPLVVVLGGAKVTDKIALIDRFLDIADALLIGGAMCFTLLPRAGHRRPATRWSRRRAWSWRARALEKAESRELPAAAAGRPRGRRPLRRRRRAPRVDGVEVPDGWMGLDIGPRTAAAYAARSRGAGTVFWNGPMGAFEMEPFAAGTRAVAEAVARRARHDGGRRRRLGRRARAVRPGRPGGPPLDRRRRLARAARGQARCRAWRSLDDA